MKFLFVSAYFAPAWDYGGPPRVLFELARHLVTHGHQVTVFTTDSIGKDKRADSFRTVLEGIEVLYFPNISNRLAYDFKIFWPLRMNAALKSRMTEFDVVCLADARTRPNALALPHALRHHVPIMHMAYGSLPVVGHPIKRVLKRMYDILHLRPILASAAACLAQTEHERQLYIQFGAPAARVHILPLATTATDEADAVIPGSVEGVSDADIVLASVGRINELKITPLMVAAFDDLVRRNARYKWVLIGRDDGYLASLLADIGARGLEGNFIFTGPLYGEEKYRLLKRADCFFLAPSHYEETSTAALEALACGTPCVITEQCEVPYMQQYNAGIMVPYDRAQLAAAIVAVVEGRDTYTEENCHRLIVERFTWEKVGARFEEIAGECIAGGRKKA